MKEKPCGCCEGMEKLTPQPTANRPGLDALSYRVGTHATFLATMKARLTDLYLEVQVEEGGEEKKRLYPLRNLTTREASDPAIALLDAWAVVGDVLTFYQERIANESYLRTATERRSIQELARLVGYKLRPGVAASVYPAFTLEKDYEVEIPVGTRAQSLPGPGELPQSFETAEPLPARAEWNELKPRLMRPQYITSGNAENLDTLYFEGTATNLKANDPMLLVFGEGVNEQVAHWVESVKAEHAENRTKVTLQYLSTTQATATLINALRQTVKDYLDLETFDVSNEREMTQRVVGVLQQLRTSLTSETPHSLSALLRRTYLPELRHENAIAAEGDYRKLKPWVGGLVEELEKAEAGLAMATGAAATAVPADAPGSGDSAVASATINLTSLLEPLLLAPSRQPANAMRLERTTETTFAPKADTAPRLLTTLKPRLKDTLYKAWAEAEVTEPSKLQSTEALRVKAAPFGHNAPLKSVYSDNGVVIDYEEWGLAEFGATFRMRLFSTDDVEHHVRQLFEKYYELPLDPNGIKESPPVGIDISIASSAGAETRQILLSVLSYDTETGDTEPVYGTGFTLGGIAVKIKVKYQKFEPPESADTWTPRIITLIFGSQQTAGLPTTQVQIEKDKVTSGRITRLVFNVTVNQDGSRTVGEGDVERYTDGGREVAIALNEALRIMHRVPAFATEVQYRTVTLDAQYDQILPGSWVIVERIDRAEAGPIISRVKQVQRVSRADYGISAKATRLVLEKPWLSEDDTSLSVLRGATIYAQTEPLDLAEEPITIDKPEPIDTIDKPEPIDTIDKPEPIKGNLIELDGVYDGLESGRWVIVSGERTDITGTSGVRASELVMVAGVTQDVQKIDTSAKVTNGRPGDKIHTTIQLANDLAYSYKRDSVTIYGNVVKATHGETRKEVLGSGDGSKELQSFTLSQSPLTHLAAATPAGAESTLEVRVNDVRWHEAGNLFELGPNDRGYITQTDDKDKTTTVFGNGRHGARLPAGAENVKAVYRFGIGKAGNVAAEKISLLATKPLGVKGVINPLAATGGAGRETRDQARRNAPLAVMALDRLVSVPDYADFARTFAGIDKASAARLSDGRRQLVHVTIAGADDIPIDETSDLYRNLCQALHQHGDPYQPIQVDMRELLLLVISAKVRLLPDYQWESVEPQIRAALLETFSFDRRQLGQDVLLSEVISVIQRVAGVAYVDVDIMDSVSEDISPDELENLADDLKLSPRIVAEMGRMQTYHVVKRNGSISGRYGITEDELRAMNPGINDSLEVDNSLRIPRMIRPAQFAYLSPDVTDTLILTEKTS